MATAEQQNIFFLFRSSSKYLLIRTVNIVFNIVSCLNEK